MSASLCVNANPLPKEKKTICLNMIVKNERRVIERCLKSVLPIIDTWVIVDTGSEDGTQECILSCLKNIPGELHQRSWKNFGHNRQEALDLAKEKADYLLFMDADDVLSFGNDFCLPDLTYDFYAVATRSKDTETILPRLVKSQLDWRWQGVLHEYIVASRDTQGTLLDHVEYVYLSDGARAHNPNRALEDIKVLENGLKDEPGNPRYLFYLAMTCFQMQDFTNALKYFEMRLQCRESPGEELFISKLHVAKIYQNYHYDPKLIETILIEACKLDPSRKEPFYYLVNLWRKQGRVNRAFQVASLALSVESKRCLFAERWVEEYGLLFEYAQCAFQLNLLRESLFACHEILKIPELGSNFRAEAESLISRIKSASPLELQNRLIQMVNS